MEMCNKRKRERRWKSKLLAFNLLEINPKFEKEVDVHFEEEVEERNVHSQHLHHKTRGKLNVELERKRH